MIIGAPGSKDGQLKSPVGVAADGSGNLYVADTGNNRIQKFSKTGMFLAKWGTKGSEDGQFDDPWGVSVDGSGNLYVADTGNNRIQKFSKTGMFLAKWGTKGSGDGQFNKPGGIAVDRFANVYVADTGNKRIQKFNVDGLFLTKWGSKGSKEGQFKRYAQWNGPWNVAVDESGDIYVTDGGNSRVQKFNSSGEYLTQWGSWGDADFQFHFPAGVAVDRSGNVYVVDTHLNRGQKFDSKGTVQTEWKTSGAGGVAFVESADVSFSETDKAFLLSSNLLKEIVPNVKFNELGAAYWKSVSNTAADAVDKVVGTALFGVFGYGMSQSRFSIGIVAINDLDLYIVEVGGITGENLTAKDLLDAHTIAGNPAKVKNAPLKSLHASYKLIDSSCVLSVKGALSFRAAFPSSYGPSNGNRGVQIAKAIETANAKSNPPSSLPPSPTCPLCRTPLVYVQVHKQWYCDKDKKYFLMSVCPNCKKNLPDGNAQFCIFCGKSLKS